MPFLANLAQLPTKSKLALGGSLLAVIVVAFVLLRIAGAPSYTILSSGLDPAQTGKITAALDEQGIAYELRSNGTALAVDKAQAAQARVALAGQGVSVNAGGEDEGWNLFDEQKLGASEMQQNVTYQRALEGEVAKTVNAVSGVSNAQVQLVLPEEDLFADTATPATAAVMLGNPADSMESGAVQGIAQLVSSSVKGLKKDNVTITDSTGQVLWPQGDAAGAGGSGSSKLAAETRFNRALESNINAMLTGTLGANKARVQVNADLNVDQTKRNELKYAKKGTPTRTKTETERLRGGGSGAAGGGAGTGANIPTYSTGAGAGGGANSNYQRETEESEIALDKTVSETIVAPGAVNKLNVALMVDQSVPKPVVDQLKASVSAAAGIDAERGDPAITVTQMPFAKQEVPKAGPVPTTMLGPIKWAGLGLATLLFLFFTRRALKKREGEALPAPAWLTTVEEPVALSELEQRTRELSAAPTIQLPPRVPDTSLTQLDQLMEREPERVAAQVKQWMSED